jgi:carboxyl-terminal processing protease
MVDKSTGYIKLESFTDSSGTEVHNAIEKLMSQGMKHCILDLRNNPGGYMREARKIADEFLPDGALEVYTIGRQGREDYFATASGLFEKGRVTILVNENTASASEILTGALQGNKRATVIGNRTFGKGLVQRIYSIGDSTEAIKLTTERYYTPLGVCIQQPYHANTYLYERTNEEIKETSSNNTMHIADAVSNWGITPDIFISADTARMNSLTGQLEYKEYIANAVLLFYADQLAELRTYNDAQSFSKAFVVTESFIQFLQEKVAAWEKMDQSSGNTLEIGDEIFTREAESIKFSAKAQLARILFGSSGYYQVDVEQDDAVQAALQLKR